MEERLAEMVAAFVDMTKHALAEEIKALDVSELKTPYHRGYSQAIAHVLDLLS